jgi:hypothetical protein
LRAKEAYFESLGVAHLRFFLCRSPIIERCGIETTNGPAYNGVLLRKQIIQI